MLENNAVFSVILLKTSLTVQKIGESGDSILSPLEIQFCLHSRFDSTSSGDSILPPVEIQFYLQWRFNSVSTRDSILSPLEIRFYLQWRFDSVSTRDSILPPLEIRFCLHFRFDSVFTPPYEVGPLTSHIMQSKYVPQTQFNAKVETVARKSLIGGLYVCAGGLTR